MIVTHFMIPVVITDHTRMRDGVALNQYSVYTNRTLK